MTQHRTTADLSAKACQSNPSPPLDLAHVGTTDVRFTAALLTGGST